MPGGGDPSSPTLPPAGLIMGWYRDVSKALSWLIGVIIAFAIWILTPHRIVGADGLSAIQPDIVEGTPEQAPSTTTPNPPEIAGSTLEAERTPALESPMEDTNTISASEPREILSE